jgi:hypothetical protein
MKYVHWIELKQWYSLVPIQGGIVACLWKNSYYSYIYSGAECRALGILKCKSIEDGKKIIEIEVKKLGYEMLPEKLEILL